MTDTTREAVERIQTALRPMKGSNDMDEAVAMLDALLARIDKLEAENAKLGKKLNVARYGPSHFGRNMAPAPVSVGEVAKDKAAFAVAKEAQNQSEGFWEPSVQQSYRILEAALRALADKGEG